MDVYNIRAKGTPFESLPGFGLAGQYAVEHVKNQSYSNASAWFAQANYTFLHTPWTPTIMYRHARYSENYDSLFNSFAGGWGTWYYGEVAGEYQLANANMDVDMLKASIQPADFVETGLIGYHIRRPSTSSSVRSGTFSNELDLYADWTVTPKLSVSTVYGIGFPGKAGKAEYAGKTAQVAEVYATYTF